MDRYVNIEDMPENSLKSLDSGPFASGNLIETCYSEALDRIVDAVNMRQSILVDCDKQLTISINYALRERLRRKGEECGDNIILIDPCNPSTGDVRSGGVQGILSRLEAILDGDVSDNVIVLQHIDLMGLGADNILDTRARDLTFCLHKNPTAMFVAFKDTEIPLPDSIKRFFGMSVSIFGIERKHLPKIISQDEAKRFGEDRVDVYNLYKHLSGLNVIQIRQLMERIVPLSVYPSGHEKVQKELRQRTLAASYVTLPSETFEEIGGCDEVIKQLEDDVFKFVDMLTEELPMEEIRKVEKFIPRNILFEGPPGTGKTVLARALANRLNAAVILINGPEFIDKYVGESERKLREIFSRARKSAPAVIIFDEIDSIGKRRGGEDEQTGYNDTVVNQLLTEMGGFRDEELVFVIGTTNHAAVLDPALLSRIQKIFNIPYPDNIGRAKIFNIYNTKKELKLSEDQIKFLVEKTEAWINPNNWHKFGGREIEALCSAIDRKTFANERQEITKDELLGLVEDKIEVHFPKITFKDIGGYKEVKDQIENNILNLMKLAKDHKDDPLTIKSIEETIPRGIIFEGPPGTGKTVFAMAMANALDASIIVISASELKSMWYGKSEKNIRTLFEQARRNSPTVIVFDEMDAMMSSREPSDGGSGLANSGDNSLVTQLLTEMDGLKSKDMVFVIGTTNLASALDRAFKRPSRFSKIIHVPYPGKDDRREILEIYTEKYDLQLTTKQCNLILEETENWIDANKYIRFSGDHLKSICQSIKRNRIMESSGLIKGNNEESELECVRTIIREMIQAPFMSVDLYEDIGGYNDIKKVLQEDILDMLLFASANKELSDNFNIKNTIPKGVVFYGPPGTGKTLFARALATALHASIRVVNGPELKSQYHGETERKIREMFDQARRYAPSVIVFDEFDSLAGERGSMAGSDRSVVNQLLTEMDGLKENELVFIVATTNHPDILDEAMKRPGRFEFEIEIPYPGEEERRAIFELYNDKYRLGLEEDHIDYLVFRTEMVVDIVTGRRFSGDHIEAICRALKREQYRDTKEDNRKEIIKKCDKEYGLKLTPEHYDIILEETENWIDSNKYIRFSGSHMRLLCKEIKNCWYKSGNISIIDKKDIDPKDLREFIRSLNTVLNNKMLDMVVRGRTNQPEMLTDVEKEIVAIHESGHAIVGKYHPNGVAPKRISIDSELAGTLGYVWHGEPENRFVRTNADLKGQVCQLLGGRAAELIIRGEQSIGCSGDLKEATRIATAMVTALGMDETIGSRCLPEAELEVSGGSRVALRKTSCHPDLLKMADDGINKIIKECQEEAERIINEHESELKELRELLLKEETVDYLNQTNKSIQKEAKRDKADVTN